MTRTANLQNRPLMKAFPIVPLIEFNSSVAKRCIVSIPYRIRFVEVMLENTKRLSLDFAPCLYGFSPRLER